MLAPSRILGLGGAYAGLAEGVDGVASNVAAPAVRSPFSGRHVDFDITASVTFPGSFASTDFEDRGSIPAGQNGSTSASNFVYANAGALVQVGPFGAALTLDATSYTLGTPTNSFTFRVLRANAIVGWAFFRHQLVVGAGVQGVTMNLATTDLPIGLPSGIAPEAGMLLKLDEQPWRLGVSARAPVSGGVGGNVQPDLNGNKILNGYILPSRVVLPGQIEIGVAVQLGPRPLNPRWVDPSDALGPVRTAIQTKVAERAKERARALREIPNGPARVAKQRELDAEERAIAHVEDARIAAEDTRLEAERNARYANWPRPKILVVADVVITAPVGKAVATSSFLAQKMEPYGGSWTVSPRFGIEGEPVVDRFRLRFGSYLEPSLFDGGTARQHFTFGGDLKLFTWNVFGLLVPTTWQLSFVTDLAPRYSNWGISIGVWR